jgi:hypothetical protein
LVWCKNHLHPTVIMSLPAPSASGLTASPARTAVSDHPLGGGLTSSMSGNGISLMTNSNSASTGLSLSSPSHINTVHHPLSPLGASTSSSSLRTIGTNAALPLQLPLPSSSSMSSSALAQLPLFATAAGQATAAGAAAAAGGLPTDTSSTTSMEPMSIGDVSIDGMTNSNERVISETDRLVTELSRLFGGTIPPSRTVPSQFTRDVRGLQTLAVTSPFSSFVRFAHRFSFDNGVGNTGSRMLA